MTEPAVQIAALPYRKTQTGVEIMLVTSRETGRWVIAKGWPMADKTDFESAAIEAFEEAGIEGKVAQIPCGAFTYEKRKKSGRLVATQVSVFALEVLTELETWPEKHQRHRQWFLQLEAAIQVQEAELQNLILAFKP